MRINVGPVDSGAGATACAYGAIGICDVIVR
jgi:hypothetical protein